MKVYCQECKEELGYLLDSNGDIYVETCELCAQDSFDGGYEDGYEDGNEGRWI